MLSKKLFRVKQVPGIAKEHYGMDRFPPCWLTSQQSKDVYGYGHYSDELKKGI